MSEMTLCTHSGSFGTGLTYVVRLLTSVLTAKVGIVGVLIRVTVLDPSKS